MKRKWNWITELFVWTSLGTIVTAMSGCTAGQNNTSQVADTLYANPNANEVEVDLEGDVKVDASKLATAPVYIGQFALTYMRKNFDVYLESIVTDASSPNRVEWLVNGKWVSGTQMSSQPAEQLSHFRIRGINAILLKNARTDNKVGTKLKATVPLDPFTVADNAAATCADPDNEDHWAPDNDIYWYLWNPRLTGCQLTTQELSITVSRTFSTHASYPDYGKLTANKKITIVGLFTAMDEKKHILPWPVDPGFKTAKDAVNMLLGEGFKETKGAPIGRRFEKIVKGITVQMDVYNPNDFGGLGDEKHFDNFQTALNEHQIIVFDGHSLLGNSDFWQKATFPNFYQIVIYGGCLGYQYYVSPIVQNKGGWQNIDIISSVYEVGANGVEVSKPFIDGLLRTISGGTAASWQEILGNIKTAVEATETDEPSFLPDTSFGVSGARDGTWSPNAATSR